MQYILKNNQLTATILAKGAELCELKDAEGTNYIWTADPVYWARHTPILFPLVGKVRDNAYDVDGQTYQLGQHGFARDMEFVLSEQSESSLIFTLHSSEATKALYPFDFTLDVIYTLENNALAIGYRVTNTDARTISFKIGAHPGFMCPLFEGETMEDYYLEFEKPEKAPLMLLTPEGLFDHTTENFEGQTIDLSPETFAKDALVFAHLESKSITLCGKKHTKKLTLNFEGFPFLGVWSPAKRSPFVCLEPWFGHADFVDDSKNFVDKSELVKLPSGEIFTCKHSIILN